MARIIEALLFASEGSLKVEQVLEVVPEVDREGVEEAFSELRDFYDDTSRGFCLAPVAGGYQLLTRPDVAPWVEKMLVGRRKQRLSRAALEVLAVVAYRQPVTRGDVEEIRGVDCGGVFRTLLDRKMVRVKGRAKTVGHPLLYVTSDHFLEHFGIPELRDLPKIEEFEALLSREAVKEELRQSGLIEAGEAPESTADSPETGATEPAAVANTGGEGIA